MEKVNINTIARTARVSTTTVSNFINGTEVFPLSRDTRGRVRAAMRKLNYRPHIGGVLIRRHPVRPGKVGFVMGEDCRQPVLYTAADTTNICLAVLQKDDAGVWQVQDAVEGLTDTVDTVRFARLQEGGADQILVGYTAQQEDNYLAVYAYEDGQIEAILAEPYGQYIIEDITGTGYEDLVLLGADETGAAQISVIKRKSKRMNENKVNACCGTGACDVSCVLRNFRLD